MIDSSSTIEEQGPDTNAYLALLTRYALGISYIDLSYIYSDSLETPEKDDWIEAMKMEVEDLKRRDVLEIT